MSLSTSDDSLCRVCHDFTFPETETESITSASDDDPFNGNADIILSDLSLWSPELYNSDYRQHSERPRRIGFRYSVFRSNIEALRVSSETCEGCDILRDVAEAKIEDPDVLKETEVVVRYPLNSPDKQLMILLMKGTECLFDLRLYATRACERWNKIPVSPYVPPNTGGLRALPQVREWMSHCLSHHLLCGLNRLALLPTRVLKLGESSVRLHISRGEERASYVCLSHCWGTSQVCTTTKENINGHIQEIGWDSLSSVFQDAITYTELIGGEYLWIDSLCIVQDDAED